MAIEPNFDVYYREYWDEYPVLKMASMVFNEHIDRVDTYGHITELTAKALREAYTMLDDGYTLYEILEDFCLMDYMTEAELLAVLDKWDGKDIPDDTGEPSKPLMERYLGILPELLRVHRCIMYDNATIAMYDFGNRKDVPVQMRQIRTTWLAVDNAVLTECRRLSLKA